MRFTLIPLALAALLTGAISAQEAAAPLEGKTFTATYDDALIATVIKEMLGDQGISFTVDHDRVDSDTLTAAFVGVPLEEALDSVTSLYGLDYVISPSGVVRIDRADQIARNRRVEPHQIMAPGIEMPELVSWLQPKLGPEEQIYGVNQNSGIPTIQVIAGLDRIDELRRELAPMTEERMAARMALEAQRLVMLQQHLEEYQEMINALTPKMMEQISTEMESLRVNEEEINTAEIERVMQRVAEEFEASMREIEANIDQTIEIKADVIHYQIPPGSTHYGGQMGMGGEFGGMSGQAYGMTEAQRDRQRAVEQHQQRVRQVIEETRRTQESQQ